MLPLLTLPAFLSAILALLLAPGPTNTLMGLAGAQRGLRGVVRLLPAELAGYLAVILPLSVAGAGVLARWPALGLGVKAAAAVWVLALALRLWGRGGAPVAATVTARQIFLTTVLNPKALIFGLVLLPAPHDPAFAPRLALFGLAVAGAALVWGMAGQLVQTGAAGPARLMRVQRLASVWLAAIAVTLLAGLFGA